MRMRSEEDEEKEEKGGRRRSDARDRREGVGEE
jgi:hypothetical protein